MAIKKIEKKRKNKRAVRSKDAAVEVLPPEESRDGEDGDIESGDEFASHEIDTLDSDEVLAGLSDDESPEGELNQDAEESNSLTRYDPLRAYLSEINQYPKLSKEEERDLAIKYLKKGDLNAAYQLTVSNLWLVVAIARKYQRAARSLLDLIQEGNIGLMDAVKNFDPYRDVRFPSYATWWIKAYIIRFVIANWRLVKIGTTQAQRKLFFNLEKEREKLEQQGFVPTVKLLASNLKVKESEIIEMQQRLGGSDLSVDAAMGSDGDQATLHSFLPSDQPTAEESLAAQQIREKIAQAMRAFSDTLNAKERTIFEKRLLSEDKATLHEIAEEFSLSKERIRQLENRIKDRLKVFLKENLGDSFLSSDLGID